MGIKQSRIEPHWNYFLAIERDLEVLSRFVEFDERNFECFSIEIARVLLAAGAEVDVVCKQICRIAKEDSKAERIGQYRDEVIGKFQYLSEFAVRVPRFGLELHPWAEWHQPNKTPFWWTAYNKIKHERRTEYHRANLKNALNAVAGLFVVVLHLYPEEARLGELVPSPQLLRPHENNFAGNTMGAFEFGINYNLKGRP